MNIPHRLRSIFVGASLLFLGMLIATGNNAGNSAWAQGKNKKDQGTPAPDDVNDLSMEVNALRTLYLLRGSEDDDSVGSQNPEKRLRALKNAKNDYAACAQKNKVREKAQVTEAYRKTLLELRGAFIAEDEARIEQLDKQLEDLTKKDEPVIDDRVEITDEARAKAGNFVKLNCSADQVAAYLAAYGKDLPNPRTLLFKTMRLGKFAEEEKPSAAEWKEIRAFVVAQVTWQVSGLNVKKGDEIGTHVGELLDQAYAMSDEDLKKNAPELRGKVLGIVNKVGPTDLLKHVIEQDIAELLSNPMLVAAAEARVKFINAKKKP